MLTLAAVFAVAVGLSVASLYDAVPEEELVRFANTALNLLTIYYLLKMEQRARRRVKLERKERRVIDRLEEVADKVDGH